MKTEELFNDGQQAFYKVTYDFSELLDKWKKECVHTVVIREEHLTGEGAMEYVEWYDCTCTACGKKWTE